MGIVFLAYKTENSHIVFMVLFTFQDCVVKVGLETCLSWLQKSLWDESIQVIVMQHASDKTQNKQSNLL